MQSTAKRRSEVTTEPWIVEVYHDEHAESPCETDGWKLYSFNSRHVSFKHPSHFSTKFDHASRRPIPVNPGLRQKLDRGLAFWLSYYEHGLGCWSLIGEGTQCQWDTAYVAGILVWEEPAGNLGPKKYADREEDARSFLKTFTSWANGECYGFQIRESFDDAIDDIDYGFYGTEWVEKEAKRVIESMTKVPDGTEFRFIWPFGGEDIYVKGSEKEATSANQRSDSEVP